MLKHPDADYILGWTEYYNEKVTGGKYWTGREIWEANWGKGSSPGLHKAKKKERCGAIIETFFWENKDGTGSHYYKGSEKTFYLYFDAVTPNISIAMGTDKMRLLVDEYEGDYFNALKEYNKSRNKEVYARNVIDLAEKEPDENNEIVLDQEEDEK